METRKFLFKASIQGKQRDLVVTVPIENGAVVTNRFCPQELLTGGLSFITAINGESIDEFISDCQKQVIAMSSASNGDSAIDIHIAGLMAIVMNHLNRCGRLIFGDLLIYMDCFSYLLSADGFSDDEIKKMYPRVARTIVELYPNYIKNTADLTPFKGSHFDYVLYNVSKQ
jgi:hypothetical protein